MYTYLLEVTVASSPGGGCGDFFTLHSKCFTAPRWFACVC